MDPPPASAPRRPGPNDVIALAHGSARLERTSTLILALLALVAADAAYPHLPTPRGAAGFVVFELCLLSMMLVLLPVSRWTRRQASAIGPAIATLAVSALVATVATLWEATDLLADLATLVLAFSAGALAVRALKRLEWVIAGLWIAALADVWSFYSAHGVTNALLSAEGYLGRIWFVMLPDVGTFGVRMSVGFVDLLAIAVLLAVCSRFRLSLARAAVSFVVVQMLVEAAVRTLGIASYPEMPVIACAMTIAFLPHVVAGPRLLRERRRAEAA